ncbi:MAG TPA: MFS transporter [Kofleriaceae bacterium]|nr:MFS transporter [Kofleriaceae bacterium]
MAVPPKSPGAARRATSGFFLMSGVAIAAWAPMVPFAKARLDLDEAQLGLLLLCLGVGSVAAMPLAGHLSHRHGSRRVLLVTGAASCALLPVLAVATTTLAMAAALIAFGAALGATDVAMNVHAVEVEKQHGAPLMSGFHGLFSAGALAGSLAIAGLLAIDVPLVVSASVIAAVLLAIVITQWPALIETTADPGAAQRSMFSLPSARALLLGALCFIVYLAEGAMLDWSAVFLRNARGFAIEDAGLGYAAFSVAMTTGRLLGDRITARVGPVRIARYGGALAAAGYVLATALPWGAATLAGFVLVGLGASNIVPVLFSAAGRIQDTPPSVALATLTTLGCAGLLFGPASIGFLAHATSLSIALCGVALLLAIVAALASIVRPAGGV